MAKVICHWCSRPHDDGAICGCPHDVAWRVLEARVAELEVEANGFRDQKNRALAALQDAQRATGAWTSMVFEGPEFYDAVTVLKAAQRDAMKVYEIITEALKG